jgi:hypothetical protein
MKNQNQLSPETPEHQKRQDVAYQRDGCGTRRIVDDINPVPVDFIAALKDHAYEMKQLTDSDFAYFVNRLRVVHARVVNAYTVEPGLYEALYRQHLPGIRRGRLPND